MPIHTPEPPKHSIRYHGRKEGLNYQKIHLTGTTFSGHPSRTTLGNTLRSILYAYFYSYKAQVDIEVMAAGDDSVVFLERADADAFIAAVKQYSSSDSTVYDTVGLGQCYKEIYLRDWNDFDFCSKTIVKDGDDWNIYRDPMKILTHK